MVLIVHGGPWARDIFGYRGDHQWLAGSGPCRALGQLPWLDGVRQKAFVAAKAKKSTPARCTTTRSDMVDWAVDQRIAQKDKIAIFGVFRRRAGFRLIGATFTPEVFVAPFRWSVISPICKRCWSPRRPYWAGFAEYMYRSYGRPAHRGKGPQAARRTLAHQPSREYHEADADLSRRQRRALQRWRKAISIRRRDAGRECSYAVSRGPIRMKGTASKNRRTAAFTADRSAMRHLLPGRLGGAFEPVGSGS